MIGKSLNEAFKFALSPKRVAIYFFIFLLVFSSIFYLLRSTVFLASETTPFLTSFFTSFALLIVVVIFLFFAAPWIVGAFVDQARYFPKDKSLGDSFHYSSSRYLSMLGAVLLLGVISFFVGLVPYIGFLFQIVVSLLFYFYAQIIIIEKKGVIDSFKLSYALFKRYVLEIFVTWLASSVISVLVIIIAAIPLLAMLAGVFFELITSQANATSPAYNVTAQVITGQLIDIAASPFLYVSLAILCLGLAFASVFMIGVQTRLYVNLKKGNR